MRGTLYVIVCASGAVGEVPRLVSLAQDDGWTVQVVATPSAVSFLDIAGLEQRTGRSVRSQYRSPREPKPPRPDAIVVAPATYNSINKFAQGIADTYALGLLAEAPGLGIPVVIVPYVNEALASRAVYQRSVAELRSEGVQVIDSEGPDPWHQAVLAVSGRSGPG